MKTIIIGLGNPILGDDAAGWRVIEVLQSYPLPQGVVSNCMAVGGLGLMENLIGYDHAILVDTIWTNQDKPGTVKHFPIEYLSNHDLGYSNSSHDTTISTALNVGRHLGAKLPEAIEIISIEARPVNEFSEQLSPAIKRAIPKAVELIKELIK
jgi:hydrogenase maturation protease